MVEAIEQNQKLRVHNQYYRLLATEVGTSFLYKITLGSSWIRSRLCYAAVLQ